MKREKLEELDKQGNLAWTKTGAPRRKLRPNINETNPIGDCWEDIPPLNSQARERLGYPTQKPLALLERIVLASSNEGDIVLDPFSQGVPTCGGRVEYGGRNRKCHAMSVDETDTMPFIDAVPHKLD